MNRLSAALVAALAVLSAPGARAQEPDAAAAPPAVTVTHQSGTIALRKPKAHIETGEGYYFIGPGDARKVLLAWGNPPESAEGVLGMLFPTGSEPMDEASWGVVVSYDDIVYVSDDDARTTDYEQLLADIKRDQERRNPDLERQGYAPVHIAGWATAPRYDAGSHVLTWAKDLQFGDADLHTLNYDLRVLGRRGVLVLQVVSSMDDLARVEGVADEIRRTAAFDSGARYADFKAGSDKLAGIGIAGLIAGGVGVVAAKKVGIIGVILLFAKKGIVLIVAAVGGVVAAVKRRLGIKPKDKPPGDDGNPGGNIVE